MTKHMLLKLWDKIGTDATLLDVGSGATYNDGGHWYCAWFQKDNKIFEVRMDTDYQPNKITSHEVNARTVIHTIYLKK